MPKTAPRRLTAALFLSLAGFVLMVMQTLEHFKVRSGTAGFESFCTIGKFDCLAVEASRYSEILPGFPLAALASAFYAALAIVLWFARGSYWRREALRIGFVMAAAGTAVSLVYLVIMVARLDTLCLFCLAQDAIVASILVLLFTLKPESFKQAKVDRERFKVVLGSGAAAAFVVLIASAMKATGPDRVPSREAQAVVDSVLSATPVALAIAESDPSIGPADAPIMIVKFSDFQCPACKMGAYALHPVMQRYGSKVRFVLKNFPLDSKCNRGVSREMHPAACEAAHAAVCAAKQGKFEAVYHAFFTHQEELGGKGPVALAKDAGLDAGELRQCMDSVDAKAAVNASVEQGLELGVQATPTFYVNGRKISGGLPTEVWIKVIDALLAQQPK